MRLFKVLISVGFAAVFVACTTEPKKDADHQSQFLSATPMSDDSLAVFTPADTVRDTELIPYLFPNVSAIESLETSDPSLLTFDGLTVVVPPKEGAVTVTATYKNGKTKSYVIILQKAGGISSGVATR